MPKLAAAAACGKGFFRGVHGRLNRARRRVNALDALDRAGAGFEVRAHQKLADEADCEQLHAEEAEHHAEHHERAVLDCDVHPGEDFFEHQEEQDCAAAQHTEHSRRPEEVQRARHVLHQEADGDDVEKNAEGA